jgi:hypothetical protein
LDKTRSLFLNRLVIIPVTENPVYSGYLLLRYDDYEEITRELVAFFRNEKYRTMYCAPLVISVYLKNCTIIQCWFCLPIYIKSNYMKIGIIGLGKMGSNRVRFYSRGESDYQDKLLSAMRFQFGGHHEKPAK